MARLSPARTRIDTRERLRLVAGSLLGIFLTGLLCHLAGWVAPGLPWLVAPLGASAVLVFAVPASPMAQPWPVVGGNTLSALAGIAGVHGVHLLGSPELAAALAVATAIALMLALRCLHPPGGATALMMVLGGISSPVFAFYPVMLNSVLLVAVGILYNNATRRAYPHTQLPPPGAAPSAEDRQLDADLDAVLARYNQVLDVSRDDLKALLAETRLRAYDRKLAEVRCEDIMSRDLVTVEFGTPLEDAWALLRSAASRRCRWWTVVFASRASSRWRISCGPPTWTSTTVLTPSSGSWCAARAACIRRSRRSWGRS